MRTSYSVRRMPRYNIRAATVCAGGFLAMALSAACTERAVLPPQCSNQLDDDGDGKVDFPADPGCSSSTDNSESPDPVAPPVTPPAALAACEDGVDNDRDGL